ncbi:MAG: hypothetical protein ACJASR_000137 [Psychroserpens sp.]|jgi:hypothetical protein
MNKFEFEDKIREKLPFDKAQNIMISLNDSQLEDVVYVIDSIIKEKVEEELHEDVISE